MTVIKNPIKKANVKKKNLYRNFLDVFHPNSRGISKTFSFNVITLSCLVLGRCMCNVIQGPPLWAFVKISRGIPRLNSPDLGSRTRGKCVKMCRAARKRRWKWHGRPMFQKLMTVAQTRLNNLNAPSFFSLFESFHSLCLWLLALLILHNGKFTKTFYSYANALNWASH